MEGAVSAVHARPLMPGSIGLRNCVVSSRANGLARMVWLSTGVVYVDWALILLFVTTSSASIGWSEMTRRSPMVSVPVAFS